MLTALAGRVGAGIRAWTRWSEGRGRPVAKVTNLSVELIVRTWLATLFRNRDLLEDAGRFLGSAAGLPSHEIRAKIATLTKHDVELFLNGLHVAEDRAGGWQIIRLLVHRAANGSALCDDDVSDLNERLHDRGAPWLRIVAAVAALVPDEILPSLLLVCTSKSCVDQAARSLAGLTSEVAELPTAIVAESTDLLPFLEESPESRHVALVREGLLTLPMFQHEQVTERLLSKGIDPAALNAASALLGDDEIPADLVDAYTELARTHQDEPESEAARSAAEQFLFDFLESHAATSGLFELNGALDFQFGRCEAEVDLVSPSLRLAIELDGYYHFQNPEDYRRDRYKDYSLQRQGYFVLRFLANDVVRRLEEILEVILDAIGHCRSHLSTGSENSD